MDAGRIGAGGGPIGTTDQAAAARGFDQALAAACGTPLDVRVENLGLQQRDLARQLETVSSVIDAFSRDLDNIGARQMEALQQAAINAGIASNPRANPAAQLREAVEDLALGIGEAARIGLDASRARSAMQMEVDRFGVISDSLRSTQTELEAALAQQRACPPQPTAPEPVAPETDLAPTQSPQSPPGGTVADPTAPADTAPADTAPAETAPADTAPADTAPADTAPADTAPADTAPADTAPADTSAETDSCGTPGDTASTGDCPSGDTADNGMGDGDAAGESGSAGDGADDGGSADESSDGGSADGSSDGGSADGSSDGGSADGSSGGDNGW